MAVGEQAVAVVGDVLDGVEDDEVYPLSAPEISDSRDDRFLCNVALDVFERMRYCSCLELEEWNMYKR